MAARVEFERLIGLERGSFCFHSQSTVLFDYIVGVCE